MIATRLSELLARIEAIPAQLPQQTLSWAGASSNAAIAVVERALGVQITGSYRDFILATGGGGVDSLYISPITDAAPLQGCHEDTLRYREDWCPHRLPPQLVVIQRDEDDNEPMCLDTSVVIDGENPVVLYYYQSSGRIEPVADSFLAYYTEFLGPRLDDAGV